MRQQHSPSAPAGWRHLFWLALLVGASIAFSLGLACAIPFAAFAAAAALTLSRRDALVLIVAIMRYCAVVLRLRWPSSSWMVRRSVPASSR